ncbi:hypothetical protein BT96DRAFT_951864, partial [Gymnopus androsaceus JB14]
CDNSYPDNAYMVGACAYALADTPSRLNSEAKSLVIQADCLPSPSSSTNEANLNGVWKTGGIPYAEAKPRCIISPGPSCNIGRLYSIYSTCDSGSDAVLVSILPSFYRWAGTGKREESRTLMQSLDIYPLVQRSGASLGNTGTQNGHDFTNPTYSLSSIIFFRVFIHSIIMFGYKFLSLVLVALTMTMISSQAQAVAIPQGNTDIEARDVTVMTKRFPNVNIVESEALISREPAVDGGYISAAAGCITVGFAVVELQADYRRGIYVVRWRNEVNQQDLKVNSECILRTMQDGP